LALPPVSTFCYQKSMAGARVSDNKKKMGRPATGVGTLIGVRLAETELGALDAWIEAQDDNPSRPEAIRKILRLGLNSQS